MLNLLPWRHVKLKKEMRKVGVWLLCAVLATSVVCFNAKKNYQERIARNTRESKRLLLEIDSNTKLIKKLKNKISGSDDSKEICGEKKFLALFGLLQTIAKTFPVNFYLTSMLLDQKGLQLEGVSLVPNYDLLKQFLIFLKKEMNVGVKVLNATPLSVQGFEYKLLLDVNTGKGHA